MKVAKKNLERVETYRTTTSGAIGKSCNFIIISLFEFYKVFLALNMVINANLCKLGWSEAIYFYLSIRRFIHKYIQ